MISLSGRLRRILVAFLTLLLVSLACNLGGAPTANQPDQGGQVSQGGGGIAGRVWHDRCSTPPEGVPLPDLPPAGCVLDPETEKLQGNGNLDGGEENLSGIEISLGNGECPSFGAGTTMTGEDGIFLFAGLGPGKYCVMIDPNSAMNASRLLPGRWTYPASEDPTGSIGQAVDLAEAELRSDVSFAWDFQFYPEYVVPTEPTPTETPTAEPTATETPTSSPTPSPTTTLQPTPTLGSGDPRASLNNPTWTDDFADSSDWNLYSDDHVRFELGDHTLIMTAFNPNFYNGWIMSWRQADNFYLETTADFGTCSGRDAFGLMFRAPTASKGYLFGVSCIGEYVLRVWDGEHMTNLTTWTAQSVIPSGSNATHRIGVWATGDEISLYAEGVFLRQLTDSTFDEGLFGLFISSGSTPNFMANVHEIAYWDLP